MSDDLGKSYIEWCRFRLMNHYWPRVERCVNELSNDDIWWREHETNYITKLRTGEDLKF